MALPAFIIQYIGELCLNVNTLEISLGPALWLGYIVKHAYWNWILFYCECCITFCFPCFWTWVLTHLSNHRVSGTTACTLRPRVMCSRTSVSSWNTFRSWRQTRPARSSCRKSWPELYVFLGTLFSTLRELKINPMLSIH